MDGSGGDEAVDEMLDAGIGRGGRVYTVVVVDKEEVSAVYVVLLIFYLKLLLFLNFSLR